MNLTYISSAEALNECLSVLNQQSQIAVDLEFDKNRFRYGFNLCLVQIFADERCFIIDPLSPQLAIQTLFPVFDNPSIRKVVYSFGEDLRLLHSLGCFPQNIYDIAIATRLLNYPQASLATILNEVLGIEINKSSQKSNWFNRPLSNNQIDYAAKDVLYLFDLYDQLNEAAKEKGVEGWVAEENAVFDKVSYAHIDNNSYLKEKDKVGLTEHEYYVYKMLLAFREAIAQKMNRPSYQIIDKNYLNELAQRPSQIHRFHKIRAVFKSLKTDEFKKELEDKRLSFETEADRLGLSRTEKEIKKIDPEEYKSRKLQRQQRDKVKKQLFKPIQAKVRELYGEHVVTYILGNRLMDDLIAGNIEQLRLYKKKLFTEIATTLDLDIDVYLEETAEE